MSKKEHIISFWKNNQKMSIKEIAEKMNMHYATVRHALKDKLDIVSQPKRSANKAKKVDELPENDPRVTALRAGEFACFCPKCGKPARARITAAIAVGGKDQFEFTAHGKCDDEKCHQSWSMFDVKRI